MKGIKFYVCGMCAALLLSSCNMNNTAKGALIGGGAGAAVGAGVGALIGKGKGAAIGAAIGTAVGAGAGALIGRKMDKAKAAAAAVENAQVASVTDANGLQAVKVTFDSGILFATGSSTLSATAQSNLADFARNVLIAYPDMDVAIQGYTDNQGWRNSTAAQSQQKNLELSQQRAASVSTYLRSCGVSATQIKSCEGYGEANPVASNATAAGQRENRRVEVYLYASQAMIEAANNGTLQ
ncbi:MAG: OmpA family protein [Bacteroidaceae bacterium]|nr:OmpA family protein [Bacteroidaceae bacterium]